MWHLKRGQSVTSTAPRERFYTELYYGAVLLADYQTRIIRIDGKDELRP